MKYCKRCHRILPDGQKKCPYCDRDAANAAAPVAEQPAPRRHRRTRTLQEAFDASQEVFTTPTEPPAPQAAEAATDIAAGEPASVSASDPAPGTKKIIFRAAPNAEAPVVEDAAEKMSAEASSPAKPPADLALEAEVFLRIPGEKPGGEENVPAENAPAEEAPKHKNRETRKEEPAESPSPDETGETSAEPAPRRSLWRRKAKADTAESAPAENAPLPAQETEPALLEEDQPFSFDTALPRKQRTVPGELELELAEHHESPADRLMGKGAVHALVAVTCIAVLVAGFFLGRAVAGTQPQPTDSIVAGYLQGGWLSDEFTFVDDDSYIMREYLTVNEDLTFTLKCLVPEQGKPEGYLDGSWQAVYTLTGTIQLSLEDGSILLDAVDEEGNRYAYTRFITNAADGQLTLREYYNNAKTEYYDVLFEQVMQPTAEPTPAA